jgi:hypothetical protein
MYRGLGAFMAAALVASAFGRLAVVSLSEEFLAHRRRQTPRVGVRRHGAWRVIWPRRMWSRLWFFRRRHARPAEFFETRTDHSKIVSSPGAGHVSSVYCREPCSSP